MRERKIATRRILFPFFILYSGREKKCDAPNFYPSAFRVKVGERKNLTRLSRRRILSLSFVNCGNADVYANMFVELEPYFVYKFESRATRKQERSEGSYLKKLKMEGKYFVMYFQIFFLR